MAWSDGINLDQVRKAERVNDETLRITWQGGEEEILHGGIARGVWTTICEEEHKYHVVPAAPGYEIVDVFTSDYRVDREPVIAWKIYDVDLTNRCSTLMAIGMISNLDEGGRGEYVKAVVCPDGKVIPHDSGVAYENLEKWIEYLKKPVREAAE